MLARKLIEPYIVHRYLHEAFASDDGLLVIHNLRGQIFCFDDSESDEGIIIASLFFLFFL